MTFFGLGEEVWVRFKHVENQALAYCRFSQNLVIKFEIELHDNFDGTVNTRWRITYTGLTQKGNQIIHELPDQLDMTGIMKKLQSYLET